MSFNASQLNAHVIFAPGKPDSTAALKAFTRSGVCKLLSSSPTFLSFATSIWLTRMTQLKVSHRLPIKPAADGASMEDSARPGAPASVPAATADEIRRKSFLDKCISVQQLTCSFSLNFPVLSCADGI